MLIDDLRTLGLSEQLVDDITSFLDLRAEDLQAARPHNVGGGAFGSSPASTQCSSDAGKAHDHVYEAMTDMVAGLKGYRDSLHTMALKTWDADSTSEAEIKTKIVRAEACEAPKFSSPSSCQLPGSSTGGQG